MELNLSQFITRLFAAAQAAGIAPAEAACSQSDSFNTRVRRGELESYQVSERISLTLRGQVGGRIGTANTQALTEESIPMLVQGVLDRMPSCRRTSSMRRYATIPTRSAARLPSRKSLWRAKWTGI